MSFLTRLTSATLVMLAGLHVAWGKGSTFPFVDQQQLADAVVGTDEVPAPASCFAVAAALTAGSAVVLGVPRLPRALRTTGLLGMAGVFGLRGALGLAGKTDLVSPGSSSVRFRGLDRRLYSPVCIGLALGCLSARRY